MKIAIISDTHDQVDKLPQVFTAIKEHSCDVIIHCGDWCSPFVAQDFIDQGLPVFTAFGNNDGDRDMIRSKFQHSEIKYEIEEEILELTLDDKKIAVNHYPDIADVLINSGQYDVVCYGHNHERNIQQVGPSWLINPGALTRNQIPGWGFVVYDTQKNTADFIDLSEK